jgi:hypothetical protein
VVWLVMGTVLAGLGCHVACHRSAVTRPVAQQIVVLGFDGADPNLASKWIAEGKLPNLARLQREGTFKPLGTTNPPESPVAWASFATGLNPGGTGIFDFLKRDPQSYLPELSLVSRERPKFLWGLIPIKAPKVTSLRSGVPFYKAAADAGFKTTVIRMPLEFPPTNLPGGKLWAGLGVPDLRGTWGTFFYFGSDLTAWDASDTEFGGKLARLSPSDGHATATIEGPIDPTHSQFTRLSIPIDFKANNHCWRASMERLVPRAVSCDAVSHPEFHLPVLHSRSIAGPARLYVAAEYRSGKSRPAGFVAARVFVGPGEEARTDEDAWLVARHLGAERRAYRRRGFSRGHVAHDAAGTRDSARRTEKRSAQPDGRGIYGYR